MLRLGWQFVAQFDGHPVARVFFTDRSRLLGTEMGRAMTVSPFPAPGFWRPKELRVKSRGRCRRPSLLSWGYLTATFSSDQRWNKTGIFGAREHFDAGTRFAQGSKALRLLHLY